MSKNTKNNDEFQPDNENLEINTDTLEENSDLIDDIDTNDDSVVEDGDTSAVVDDLDTDSELTSDIDTSDSENSLNDDLDIALNDKSAESSESKNKPKNNVETFKVSKKFKSATYSIVITAIFLAVVIVLNIVATGLENNFPLTIDLSSNNAATLSQENIDYVNTVEQDIEIVICTADGEYPATMDFIAKTSKVDDPSVGKYYQQTLDLLDQYEKHNSHISVEYSDPKLPGYTDMLTKLGIGKIPAGSIVVMAPYVNEAGETITRNNVITFGEQYSIGQSSVSGSYMIEGNTIEQAISSSIYNVTSEKTFEAVILGGHGSVDMDYMQSELEKINYNFTLIEDLNTQDIPPETDIVFIVAPTTDYSTAELDELTRFLYNDNKKEKSMFYFDTGVKGPKTTPNFDKWLSHWGIYPSDGRIYETNPKKHDPMSHLLSTLEPDEEGAEFTADLLANDGVFYGSYMRPATIGDADIGYTPTNILTTTNTAVAMPPGVKEKDFDPETSKAKGPFTALAMSEWKNDSTATEDVPTSTLFYANCDFFLGEFSAQTTLENTQLIVNCINYAVGSTETDLSLFSKHIATANFTDKVNVVNSGVMTVFFVYFLPLVTFVLGFVIWFRRRRL